MPGWKTAFRYNSIALKDKEFHNVFKHTIWEKCVLHSPYFIIRWNSRSVRVQIFITQKIPFCHIAEDKYRTNRVNRAWYSHTLVRSQINEMENYRESGDWSREPDTASKRMFQDCEFQCQVHIERFPEGRLRHSRRTVCDAEIPNRCHPRINLRSMNKWLLLFKFKGIQAGEWQPLNLYVYCPVNSRRTTYWRAT